MAKINSYRYKYTLEEPTGVYREEFEVGGVTFWVTAEPKTALAVLSWAKEEGLIPSAVSWTKPTTVVAESGDIYAEWHDWKEGGVWRERCKLYAQTTAQVALCGEEKPRNLRVQFGWRHGSTGLANVNAGEWFVDEVNERPQWAVDADAVLAGDGAMVIQQVPGTRRELLYDPTTGTSTPYGG